MDASIFLARLIGPMFVVVGIGVLLNASYYVDMLKRFLENKELYYFSGTLALLVGIAIVQFHNIWVADWRVVITLIGWASIFKGIARILLPKMGSRFLLNLSAPDSLLYASSFFIVAAGIWLSYKGYAV